MIWRVTAANMEAHYVLGNYPGETPDEAIETARRDNPRAYLKGLLLRAIPLSRGTSA